MNILHGDRAIGNKLFTMGIRHDVEQGLEKYEITKIDGQPTD